MYNRYVGNTGKFYRVGTPEPQRNQSNQQRGHNPPQQNRPPSPPPMKTEPEPIVNSFFGSLPFFGGIEKGLSSILPGKMDSGDLMLLLLLFFLYLESKDEDFLIILAVIAMSIFKD